MDGVAIPLLQQQQTVEAKVSLALRVCAPLAIGGPLPYLPPPAWLGQTKRARVERRRGLGHYSCLTHASGIETAAKLLKLLYKLLFNPVRSAMNRFFVHQARCLVSARPRIDISTHFLQTKPRPAARWREAKRVFATSALDEKRKEGYVKSSSSRREVSSVDFSTILSCLYTNRTAEHTNQRTTNTSSPRKSLAKRSSNEKYKRCI